VNVTIAVMLNRRAGGGTHESASHTVMTSYHGPNCRPLESPVSVTRLWLLLHRKRA